jgi:type VI secretion system VasD/TssJ family lipoprotein
MMDMPRPSHVIPRLITLAFIAVLGSVSGLGCKKEQETCKPEDHPMETVRLVVGPADVINVDPDGNPRATVLHLVQLNDDRVLDTIDFESVFTDIKTAFGDSFLEEKEIIAYPEKSEIHEIKPNEEATHFAVVALFREPIGNAWFKEWDVPRYHGHSVCAGLKKKQVVPNPCFYLSIENNEVDGGHKPPPGWQANGLTVQCPGPPMLVPPPPELSKKEKRKEEKKKKREERKKKLEGGAKDAQDKAGKAKDANTKAGEATDAATTKPEAPEPPVPGGE